MHARDVQTCARCRSAKRLCDRLRPACTRCNKAKADCIYEAQVSETPPLESSSCPETASDTPSTTSSPHSVVKRRARACLSCTRCHRLKIKCDRRAPCSRCIRSGYETTCIYTHRLNRSEKLTLPSSIFAIEDPEFVVATWFLRRRGSGHFRALLDRVCLPYLACHNSGKALAEPATIWSVRLDFSRTYRWKCIPAGLEALPGLQAPPFVMAMREHIAGNCSSDFALAGNFPFGSPESQSYTSFDRVRKLLQTSTSDAALYVEAYFRVYDPGLPVLDKSLFMSKMESCHDAQLDPSWLAQYFVVLGLGSYALTRDEVASSEYFYASEACLAKTSYMFRPTVVHISTLCLMVLAKSVAYATCWVLDTSWSVMGLVVRLSMMMVLQKDWMPGYVEPVISHERNLRRHLWVVVAYLDIQMSLITGQQSLLPQDALLIRTETCAPSVLEDCFDSILPQSFPIICHFLARINTQIDQITYEEAVQYDLELRQLMRQASDLPGNERLRLALDVFFRRALSVLHGHYALAHNAALVYPVSYWSSLDCNFAMMRHHQNLGLPLEQDSDLGLVAQPYMLDFFAAALTTCVHLLSTAPPTGYPLPDRQTVYRMLEDCVKLIGREESKSLCFRTGYHLLNAVFGLTCKQSWISQSAGG